MQVTSKNSLKSGISALETTPRQVVILHHQTNTTNPQKNKTMKTTKIFSVLSLALIFITATSAFSAGPDKKNDQVAVNTMIRYQVNIKLDTEKPLCNLWLVKILDQNGRMVAPAKAYSPSVTVYNFFERGPAEGTRVAVLVKYQYGDHYVCQTELFTAPAILSGKFLNGETYRFDLYPSTQPSKE